ncbi:MAG: PA2169 family four-helix-bundle protein [Bryobacteraceae bacterium]|nr:PA2169 family four-helix-bundle protein [Bryobacteraceae bacterium]
MAVSTDQFTETLNDLVETCKDGEKGFREAAEGITNSSTRTMFQKFAQERAEYARELQSEISRLGGTPETGGSASGALHRGWINLKSAVTGRNDKAIVDEAERGEDIAVAEYQKALAKDIPSDLKSIVERQYSGVQAAHNEVRNLKHSMASN